MAAAKDTLSSLPTPQLDLGAALSVGVFLAGGAVPGSPNSTLLPLPKPRESGALGWTDLWPGRDGDSWKEKLVLLPKQDA